MPADETYDGQQQGGISAPQQYPFIFLFTGDTGGRYRCRDKWGYSVTVVQNHAAQI